mmetsp:Transcript_28584/g.37432  ORF Transcript_28584/g.37432 Transcript_28584/m.37432 type:complete len:178 (+) Transcript_28584:147-680(+)|eukprot:CAMPEP_0117765816 /NCGR_PEP_ID=MMETSP0947-20121206/20395_1 /TAXON_ID=44440 /ORGANISM="Chattonella subsalsa, Strain CCMP2191" /LENGTH=177 /DNA_ID=CAMNT_0005588659 /DNA_START=76 /DNA_END=609 /DNA_ORIENTATION=+
MASISPEDGSGTPQVKQPLAKSTNQPKLMRSNSSSLSHSTSINQRILQHQQSIDWHLFLTIEERQAIREKIKAAYRNSCKSYEHLLEVAAAIEEESLHVSAPSRLDYFRTGCLYTKTVKEKMKALFPEELTGDVSHAGDSQETTTPLKAKRTETSPVKGDEEESKLVHKTKKGRPSK